MLEYYTAGIPFKVHTALRAALLNPEEIAPLIVLIVSLLHQSNTGAVCE